MRKKGSKDLTQGNIFKQLVLFALPIFAGQIFQNLYNSVDSIVAGRALGKTALAAISASADISMLLTGFFVGFSTGGGVLIARYFGAKDQDKLERALHTLVSFGILIGLFMGSLGIILSPQLLHIVKCPDDVYKEALSYLRVYLIGVLFTAIYNVGSRALQSVGDSQRPFYYLVISSIVNIFADLLFVLVFKWGVMGTALATILSQALSCFMVYYRMLTTDDVYRLELKKLLKMDGGMLKEIISLGLPAAIQSCLIGVSNLFVQRYTNGFGSAAMAGTGAAKKIDRFVGMIAQSLGLAVTTFVSQNVGAEKYHRAFNGIKVALLICAVYTLAVGSVIFIKADWFVGIFIQDKEAIGFGVGMIHYMIPLYYAQALNAIFANAVRGFGKSFVVMICSIVGMIGCRQVFLNVSMAINPVIRNVYLAMPVGWVCAAALAMAYFFIRIYPVFRKKAMEESASE